MTYKEKIQSQFSDYNRIFVYLTPEGEIPSDDEWMVLEYADVIAILEKVYKPKESLLGFEVSLLIRNYINNVKKNVIMDPELINLCHCCPLKNQNSSLKLL